MMNVRTAPVVKTMLLERQRSPRPTSGEAMPPAMKPAAPRTALARPAYWRDAFIAIAVEGASMRPKLPIMAKRKNSNSQTGALSRSAAETSGAAMRNCNAPARRLF